VEVHGYADVPAPDETTAALAGRCAGFRNLAGLSDQAAADAIRADGLDILVDLAGHVPGGLPSVFAYTPAPVQIAGPGYDCTRGLPALTHRLTDAATDPLGAETYGPESILRLDRPALAYIPFPEAGEPGPLPALTHGHLTFGYFGPLDRLNDGVLEAWAMMLAGLRGSRLSLPALPADPRTRALWLGRLENAGLDLDRIGFRPAPDSVEAHLAAYGTVDIALADFPQPSPAALCEALYMGLPVIGVERRTHAFRPGLGVLAPLGFEAWMPATPRELAHLAQSFALHLPGLAALRSSLRARLQASPLLDAPGLARALEATYRALWASALS
jgi:predicted O-linked N-acetylglucosamine transferase (SPINDLY family)